MRFIATMALCAGVVLITAGCDPTDKHYFTRGVGTELHTTDAETQTSLQNAYVVDVCRQAGLEPSSPDAGTVVCGRDDPGSWWLFVQAGMNDIDQRCDAYLTWLDNVRRSREPILNQLSQTRTATETIMTLASVGTGPINIVGTAFGLASNTFTNINSRLILDVPHSTVQAVVLSYQKRYRDELISNAKHNPPIVIVSRPDAVYALRSYLRLCMPMTIETEINNTVTTVARSGPDALKNEPLISAKNVGVPLRPEQKISRPQRPPQQPTLEDYATIIKNYNPAVHTISKVERVLSKLCIPAKTPITIQTNTAIKVFQQTRKNPITGVLNDAEVDLLANAPVCKPDGARNYFEKNSLPNGINSDDLVKDMNLVLDKDHQLPIPATGSEVRNRIAQVRDALRNELTLQSNELPDQFSPDLFNALVKRGLFARPNGAPAPTPAVPTPAPSVLPVPPATTNPPR